MTEIETITSDNCPNCGINLDKLWRVFTNDPIKQKIFNGIIYHNILCENCNCTIEFIHFRFMNYAYYPITTRVLISNKNKIFKAFNKMIDMYAIYKQRYNFSDLNISNLPSSIDYKQELKMFIKLNL